MAEVSETRNAGAPAPEQQESAKGGVGSWIVGVFTSPGATFASIAEKLELPHPKDPAKTKDMSKWWLPVLIAIIIAVGLAFYTIPNFVAPMQADAVRESVMARGGTEADVQQALSISGAMMLPMGIVGIIVVTVIIVFLMALVLHLLMKMVGGKGRFRHARAVVGWTMLISTLGSLLKLPLMIAKDTAIVETGPSLFFKSLEPSDTLFKLLSGFDIFTIWGMAVKDIRYFIVNRVSTGKAWVAVAALWILVILLMTLSPGGMGAGM